MQLHQRSTVAAAPYPGVGDEVLRTEQHGSRQARRYPCRTRRTRSRSARRHRRMNAAHTPRAPPTIARRPCAVSRRALVQAMRFRAVRSMRATGRRSRGRAVRPASAACRSTHAARSDAMAGRSRGPSSVTWSPCRCAYARCFMQLEVRCRMHRHVHRARALAPDAQRDQLRHGAARHECAGRLAQERGDPRLERLDQIALAIAIGGMTVDPAPFADPEQLVSGRLHRVARDVQGAGEAQRLLRQSVTESASARAAARPGRRCVRCGYASRRR